AYFDAHLQLVSAAMLGSSDVVVAFSHVGRMPSLLESIASAAAQGACVIAITHAGTPLAERAQIALTVDVPEDAVMRVGTEAYLVHLTVIEILMTCVAQRRDEMVRSRMRAIQRLLTERSVDRP
ncbi:RpiR family transcriptional regulator, partial [Klebsiella michiganensis]|uniref:MurR/RpiR family transcriptional regulator n=1 Tax=Klebsiella michiganensis TaxID=1134687 RepID=UPI000E2A0C45